MIISLKQEAIFIKTKKTAGTSFEIAMTKFCGPQCIITPISTPDERLRQDLGFGCAQNFKNYFWRKQGVTTTGEFFNHIPARAVRESVPHDVWNGLKKITIVRNPYDVAISRYYWEGGGRKLNLNFLEYLRAFPEHLVENLSIAPLSGPDACDVYLRYESLCEDLEENGLLYLWDTFSKIRAKSHLRPRVGASVEEVFKKYPEAALIIEQACTEEIQFSDYRAW